MADNENELVAPQVSPDAAEVEGQTFDGSDVTNDDQAQADAAASAEVTGAPKPSAPASHEGTGTEVRDAEGPAPAPESDDEPEVPLGAGVSDDWKHIVVRDRQPDAAERSAE